MERALCGKPSDLRTTPTCGKPPQMHRRSAGGEQTRTHLRRDVSQTRDRTLRRIQNEKKNRPTPHRPEKRIENEIIRQRNVNEVRYGCDRGTYRLRDVKRIQIFRRAGKDAIQTHLRRGDGNAEVAQMLRHQGVGMCHLGNVKTDEQMCVRLRQAGNGTMLASDDQIAVAVKTMCLAVETVSANDHHGRPMQSIRPNLVAVQARMRLHRGEVIGTKVLMTDGQSIVHRHGAMADNRHHLGVRTSRNDHPTRRHRPTRK